METPRLVRLRQLPGLDGLRAIAVIAVIVYHLNASWLPGGFLGVDVFFVISGYLITSLLLAEFERTDDLALGHFLARRARRLLPAVGLLLFAVTLLAAFFARDALGTIRGDLPATIFYAMNWHLLFEHASYATSFGRPSLLQHLWSLSVEEQFYLLWPPALLLLRRRFTRAQVGGVAAMGALLSAALMAGLYSASDPSGVYYATETHAEGLLIGCALAAAIPPWHMSASITTSARKVLDRCGLTALVLVGAGLVFLGFNSPATYRGGMLAVDLFTAVVVATVAHPASQLGRALCRQPMRWVGLRSYSLYLWHWPIFELLRPGEDISWSPLPAAVLRLALTGLAAEFSYRYVERPWREGRAELTLRRWFRGWSAPRVLTVVAAPLLLVSAILATAPTNIEPAVLDQGETAAARSALAPTPPTTAPVVQVNVVSDDAGMPTLGDMRREALVSGTYVPGLGYEFFGRLIRPAMAPPAKAGHPVAPKRPGVVVALQTDPAAAEPILAIGDSVLLAASPALTSAFGSNITVDAQVGRQVNVGLARLAAYRSSGQLAHYRTVLIDLGTNGSFSAAEFAQMTTLLAGVAHVVVYDVHVPRPWAATTNSTVSQGVAAHTAQMKLVDWNSAAGGPGLLYPDGIHPDPAGAAVYTQLLRRALA